MKEAYLAVLAERKRVLQDQIDTIFRMGGEFVCELGCGHGHFLTAYAAAHPKTLCIGVDLEGERIRRACRKRDRAGLRNLHFLHAEAGFFLETLPPAARIAALFLLFPDPWPKLRHNKHRIVQTRFLDVVAARGTQGCRLAFRTDYEPYFLEAQATIRSHPRWQLVDEAWPFEYATVFQQRAKSHASCVAGLRSFQPFRELS